VQPDGLSFSDSFKGSSIMRVTQKTIAAELGVSISLVSRVLSGSAQSIGVPSETIRQVEEVSKRLGYVPNRAAQALKGKASRTIGVVVYDFKDPFFSDFVGYLQERLHANGYSTILVGFSDRQIDSRDLNQLRQHLLDAIIVLGSDSSWDAFGEIRSTPVFRIGHGVEDEPCARYEVDEPQAAEDLGEYLLRLHCKKVQLVRFDMWNHKMRADAMQAAFEKRGMSVSSHTSSLRPYFELGRRFAMMEFNPYTPPDVLVCTTDQIALGVIKGLTERGIKVPDQVKVTGFDDIQFSRWYYPSLTTFTQPMPSLIDRIIERIRNQDFAHGSEVFHCPLVARASC
jgi:LacI family transcriptional regulator